MPFKDYGNGVEMSKIRVERYILLSVGYFQVNQVCGIIFVHSTKQATAGVVPHHWQPNSGLVMTNDTADTNPEEAVPCIALSKNDSYVMSACGGKVSLFNMMTFKVMFNYFIRMHFSDFKKI